MRKILAIFLSLAIISAVSCSKTDSSEQEQTVTQNYTAEKLTDVANYGKESMTVPENCSQIWSFMPYNKGNDFLLLGSGTKTPEFWHTSDFENYEVVEFPEFDVGVNYGLNTADDGTVITFVVHADYGDLPPIVNYEYPEGYTEEMYDENAEYSFIIKTYKDGKSVSSAEVADFSVVPDKMTSIQGVCSNGEIVVALISGAYEIFSIDGEYIGELSSDAGDIDTIGKNRDGKLICTVAYKDGENDKLKICFINPDGTLMDYNTTTYDFGETSQGIQQGTGEYDFFLWSRSTVFGIKQDTAEIVSLFNINVSGITSDVINGLTLTDNGNIAVISNDYTSWTVNFMEYIPRTKEEMEGIPILKYGVCAGEGEESYYMENINEWNNGNHDFMLELKYYAIDWEDESSIFNEIQEDIISGDMPDIIYNDGMWGEINLAETGALCDLYEFIDNDSEINRETFVPNVLECFETDGKLYSLPDRFYINTGKVAKTKFVGDGSDWNFEKYIDMVMNPPVDIEIEYDSKDRRRGMINSTGWIDFETYTCNYTDESFIKFLNWCNIPDIIESVYPDWEDTTEEEDRNNYIRQQRRYIDDKEILGSLSWFSYSNYVQDIRGQFGGEEITYLETPYIEGNDNIAISSTSEYKEFAWEYIKSKISDESYEMPENGFTSPFPITKTGLKYYENYERTHYTDYTRFDETKDNPEWKDYKGIVYQLQFSAYEDCIKCGEITDGDVQAVNDLIAKAESSEENYIPLDMDFYTILDEEFMIFFNGDCTAEECAENIQSRVSIYLSEKFG